MLRHAIAASEIATIRYRQAHIGDVPPEAVDQPGVCRAVRSLPMPQVALPPSSRRVTEPAGSVVDDNGHLVAQHQLVHFLASQS